MYEKIEWLYDCIVVDDLDLKWLFDKIELLVEEVIDEGDEKEVIVEGEVIVWEGSVDVDGEVDEDEVELR